MAFQPDWRIDGEKYQYAIVRKLGEGGFGITYLAMRSDGKQVVIKTLNDEMQKNNRKSKKPQQQFIKEAVLLDGLKHQHIVEVFDMCQSMNLDCMVMDYIDGGSLYDRIDKHGVLSEEDALRYIKQIGSALEYMHDPTQHEYPKYPILHRDLKPQNIMLRLEPDEAILIDFGIAREFTPNKTAIHTSYGSRGFMPIEQIDRRRKRGAYTDVYGLAAILYYALTKESPPDVLLINSGIEELVPPKQHNSNVSKATNNAILWGMKLEPKDRPQTVQEWLESLDVVANKPPKKISHRDVTKTVKASELIKTIPYQDVNKQVKASELIKTIPYQDVNKQAKASELIKTIPYRDVVKPAKPAKSSEPPRKIPYRVLAIGGGLYAINTFCLVFFHVLTWQLAKEMAVLFLLPFAVSSAVAIWLKNKDFEDYQVFFASLLTGMVISGGGCYLLGGTNLNESLGVAVAWAVAWAMAWAWALVWAWDEVVGGSWVLAWAVGESLSVAVAWAVAWALVWAMILLASSVGGAWAVALGVLVLAIAVSGAITLAIVLAWDEEKKSLEKLGTVCVFLSATPLGIPFIFAIIDMNKKSFSKQKVSRITMGTIILGLIVGGGLGMLAR
jgi:serine/threonine protein kinase